MKTPWRYWLTGGIAVVLAAASQARAAPDARSVRASRYGVDETVRRIADTARRRGLPVFAQLDAAASRFAPGRLANAGMALSLLSLQPARTLLLVLGSDETHTAVLQTAPGAALALPLAVRVAPGEAGGAQVGFTDGRWLAGHAGLPGDLLDRVAALSGLVDAALEAGPSRGA